MKLVTRTKCIDRMLKGTDLVTLPLFILCITSHLLPRIIPYLWICTMQLTVNTSGYFQHRRRKPPTQKAENGGDLKEQLYHLCHIVQGIK